MTAELESPAHGPQGPIGPVGPAGPPGPQGPNALALLADVDLTDVGDGQALVYVAAQLAGGRPWRPVDVAEQDELDVVAAAVAVLEAAMPTKAADAGVVHLAGAENVAGAKNFTGGLTLAGAAVETVAGSQAKADAAVAYADATFLPLAQRGAPGGVPTLDGASLIPNAFLPPLAITDRFPVASQAEMLALAAETGDIAVRTDQRRTYMLRGDPAVLGNWQELLSPLDTVTSVNAQVGVVQLTAADIPYAATTVEAQLDAIAADPRWADPRAPTGPAGGVLAGTYPDPGFAAAPTFTGTLTALAASAGNVPVVIQGAASQTGHLLDLNDSTGAVLSNFSSAGKLTLGRSSVGSSVLNVYAANTQSALFINTQTPSSSSGAGMIGRTDADPTAVDQRLGFLLFGSPLGSHAGVAGFSAEPWTSGARGTYLTFETTAVGGTARNEKMRLTPAGKVGINAAPTDANGAMLYVLTATSGTTAVTLRGSASQSVDLLQAQDSAGAVLAAINQNGRFNGAFGALASGKAVLSSNADTGGFVITTANDANKGLVIRRNSVTQTANLLELQTDSSTNMAGVTKDGNLFAFRVTAGSTSANSAAMLFVPSGGAANVAAIIKAAASQTGDLLQAQDSTGANLARIASDGGVYAPKLVSLASGKAYIGLNIDTGGMGVFTQADANKGMVFRRFSSSQSANVTEWQTDAGAVQSIVDGNGRFGIRNTAALGGAALSVSATTSGNIAQIIQALASQSVDLTEWRDSAGVVTAKVDQAGSVFGATLNTLNSKLSIVEENSGGRLNFAKATAQAANPTADRLKLYVRDGTNAGTLKLVALGPGGVQVTIVDNVA